MHTYKIPSIQLKLFSFLNYRCVNGGTCIDGIDEFTCSCPTGLTGLFCECLLLETGDMDCNYTAPETSSIIYSTEYDTAATSQPFTISSSKTSIPIHDKTNSIVPNATADISSTTTIQIPTQMSTDTETSTQFNTLFTTIYTSLETLSTMFTESSSSSSSSIPEAIVPTSSTTTISIETETTTSTTTDNTSNDRTTSTIQPIEIMPPIELITTPTTPSTADITTTGTSGTVLTTLTPYFTDSPQSSSTSRTMPSSSTTTIPSSTANDDSRTSTSDTTMSPTWPTVTQTMTTETMDTTTITYRVDNFTGIPDCMKIPCFNGGTCTGTSEGAKVSIYIHTVYDIVFR